MTDYEKYFTKSEKWDLQNTILARGENLEKYLAATNISEAFTPINKAGYSVVTVRRMIKAIRKYIRWLALEQESIPMSVLKNHPIQMTLEGSDLVKFLSPKDRVYVRDDEHLSRLLCSSNIASDELYTKDLAGKAIAILGYMGFTTDEIAVLETEDVHDNTIKGITIPAVFRDTIRTYRDATYEIRDIGRGGEAVVPYPSRRYFIKKVLLKANHTEHMSNISVAAICQEFTNRMKDGRRISNRWHENMGWELYETSYNMTVMDLKRANDFVKMRELDLKFPNMPRIQVAKMFLETRAMKDINRFSSRFLGEYHLWMWYYYPEELDNKRDLWGA